LYSSTSRETNGGEGRWDRRVTGAEGNPIKINRGGWEVKSQFTERNGKKGDKWWYRLKAREKSRREKKRGKKKREPKKRGGGKLGEPWKTEQRDQIGNKGPLHLGKKKKGKHRTNVRLPEKKKPQRWGTPKDYRPAVLPRQEGQNKGPGTREAKKKKKQRIKKCKLGNGLLGWRKKKVNKAENRTARYLDATNKQGKKKKGVIGGQVCGCSRNLVRGRTREKQTGTGEFERGRGKSETRNTIKNKEGSKLSFRGWCSWPIKGKFLGSVRRRGRGQDAWRDKQKKLLWKGEPCN